MVAAPSSLLQHPPPPAEATSGDLKGQQPSPPLHFLLFIPIGHGLLSFICHLWDTLCFLFLKIPFYFSQFYNFHTFSLNIISSPLSLLYLSEFDLKHFITCHLYPLSFWIFPSLCVFVLHSGWYIFQFTNSFSSYAQLSCSTHWGLSFHTIFLFQIYLFVSNYPLLTGHFLLLFCVLFLTISLSVILVVVFFVLLTFHFNDLFSCLIGGFCVALTAWFWLGKLSTERLVSPLPLFKGHCWPWEFSSVQESLPDPVADRSWAAALLA